MKYLSASVCCCRCIIIVVIVLLTIGRISRICVLMPFVSSGTFSLFASAPRGLSCRGTPVRRASTSPRARPRPAPAPRRSEPSFLLGLHFTLSKKLCLFFCVKFLVFVSFQILNVRSGSLTPYMYFCVFRFGSGSRSVMTLPRVALMCLRGKASSFPGLQLRVLTSGPDRARCCEPPSLPIVAHGVPSFHVPGDPRYFPRHCH